MFSVADRDCSSGLGPFIRTRARGGYLELSTDAVLYKLAVDMNSIVSITNNTERNN